VLRNLPGVLRHAERRTRVLKAKARVKSKSGQYSVLAHK
jgi:hypothetical protein